MSLASQNYLLAVPCDRKNRLSYLRKILLFHLRNLRNLRKIFLSHLRRTRAMITKSTPRFHPLIEESERGGPPPAADLLEAYESA